MPGSVVVKRNHYRTSRGHNHRRILDYCWYTLLIYLLIDARSSYVR
jgi:hypothetical protein